MRPSVLPSANCTASAPRFYAFAAQWLAYALPYRRFTCALTGAGARLGADAVRYSFIAADFHRLLLAGLPALTQFSFWRGTCLRYRAVFIERLQGGNFPGLFCTILGESFRRYFFDGFDDIRDRLTETLDIEGGDEVR